MAEQQPTPSLQRFLGDADGQPDSIEDSARDVGARLAQARVKAGRSQADVANQLGVKESTLDRWERGVASPRSNRLSALAGILGVSLPWLFVGYRDSATSGDDLDEIKSSLNRVHSQLTGALGEVEALMARLDSR